MHQAESVIATALFAAGILLLNSLQAPPTLTAKVSFNTVSAPGNCPTSRVNATVEEN